MGAHNVDATFDGSLSAEALRKAFADYQEQLTYEYGTDAYNGTFSTCQGLVIDGDGTWGSAKEAREYALKKAHKWGPAVAVKVRNVQTETESFLFDGKASQWTNGPVMDVRGSNPQAMAADQLSENDKARALTLYATMRRAENEFRQINTALQEHLGMVLSDHARPIPKGWTTQLRAYRKAYVKAEKARTIAKEKYTKFAEDTRATYLRTTQKDLGVEWHVHGWAAC